MFRHELGGSFKHLFNFHPYLGKFSNLTSIFFRWVEATMKPPTSELFDESPEATSGDFFQSSFCIRPSLIAPPRSFSSDFFTFI